MMNEESQQNGRCHKKTGRAVRGPAKDRVVLMPMMIKTQMEGGIIVAVMPAWQLPTGLTVEGASLEDAVESLASRMREHWGGE